MKAEDLIKNNSLTNIEVTGSQTVVFSEIALTAVNMAREEMNKVKTLKQWERSGKDLDEFLSPGDWISEDLRNYIGEIVPPYYCSRDFVQGGDAVKSEDGVLYYCTCHRTEDNRYLYLGVLPEFKQ